MLGYICINVYVGQGFRPLTTGFEPARHLQAKIQSSTEEGDRRKKNSLKLRQ